MQKTRATFIAVLIAIFAIGLAAQEQAKPSPPGTATFTFADGKTVTVDYSRPSMRGRKIFGGLVPYGQVWRTGANSATSLKTTANLTIGGASVPAGNYTLYTLPGEKAWKLIINKETGHTSQELAYGITSRSAQNASPQRLLEINRGHWTIENCCHYVLDWNFDEDRCRIRTGYGPENITRLRRFAIGLIQSRAVKNVAHKIRQLNRNIRAVFDYLRMSNNSCTARPA